MKVGRNLDDDIRRAALIREVIGWDHALMMDANQIWDVDDAISWDGTPRDFSSVMDRRADEPGRCSRTRDDCAGGQTHRRRDG